MKILHIAFAPYGAFGILADKEEEDKELTLEDIAYKEIFSEDSIVEIMYNLKNENFDSIIKDIIEKWDISESYQINNELEVGEPNILGKLVRKYQYEIGKNNGVFSDYDDYINKMNLWNTELTRRIMKQSSGKKDKLIIQTVSALDDLDETLNLFSERLREWYSLYFPEMDKLVKKHDLYVNLVSDYGNRESYTRTRLKKSLPSKLARTLSQSAKDSMGAELSDRDIETIKTFADNIKSLYNLRENLQKYLEELMEETAPNLTKLAGASLGARLISLAGGLDRLSKLPSSTIQVIGAEKALFAHLREGADPPKHGVIFQHPYIQSSPWWIRGKVSRALACKLAIGIRGDAFGDYIADELMEELNKKIEYIKNKYPEPKRKKKSRSKSEKSKVKKEQRKGKKDKNQTGRNRGKSGNKGKNKIDGGKSRNKNVSNNRNKKDRKNTKRKVIGKTSKSNLNP